MAWNEAFILSSSVASVSQKERQHTCIYREQAMGGFGNQMYQKGEANCDHRNGWYKWHSNSVSRGGLTWSIWEQEEKCRSQTGTNTPG